MCESLCVLCFTRSHSATVTQIIHSYGAKKDTESADVPRLSAVFADEAEKYGDVILHRRSKYEPFCSVSRHTFLFPFL